MAQSIYNRAAAIEGLSLEVHSAARIDQGRIPTDLDLRPTVWRRTSACARTSANESQSPVPGLTDGHAAHKHMLRPAGPVHAQDLRRLIVPAAVEDVGLRDPIRGQNASRVLSIDRQVGPDRTSNAVDEVATAIASLHSR